MRKNESMLNPPSVVKSREGNRRTQIGEVKYKREIERLFQLLDDLKVLINEVTYTLGWDDIDTHACTVRNGTIYSGGQLPADNSNCAIKTLPGKGNPHGCKRMG